jgi:hypothetical protein
MYEWPHIAILRCHSVLRLAQGHTRVARFSNQKSQFGKILEGLGMEDVSLFYSYFVYVTAIWYILRSFGIHLMAIWYIFPVLVCCPKKIWQPRSTVSGLEKGVAMTEVVHLRWQGKCEKVKLGDKKRRAPIFLFCSPGQGDQMISGKSSDHRIHRIIGKNIGFFCSAAPDRATRWFHENPAQNVARPIFCQN